MKAENRLKTPQERLEYTLRQKFVMIAISVVFVVLTVIFSGVNGFHFLQIQWKAQSLIEIITDNNGTFPQNTNRDITNQPRPTDQAEMMDLYPRINEESPFTTRYFTVYFDEIGQVTEVNATNINRISPHEGEDLARTIYTSGKKEGLSGIYYYNRVEKPEGDSFLVFLDISQELYFYDSLFMSSAVICVLSVGFVLLLLVLVSKRVVAPIVTSYARQKSFITDMSHELKTPLAIVKANTEVLELEHGNSQWSRSTHKQIAKLNYLVTRLLSLAKLEETEHTPLVVVSISKLVQEGGEHFRGYIEQEGKKLDLQVEKNLYIQADTQAIRQLLDILIENAVKYSINNATLSVALYAEKHTVHLKVINQAENVVKGNYDKWFERFYREECSRNSETGGFGLGLSMAKRFVKQYGGKITAHARIDGEITLQVEFRKHEQKIKV